MILKLSQQKRPKKPEGAVHLGLTAPIWETVEICWKTRPSERLTVTQVLESWEKEINGEGLPAAERSGRRLSLAIARLGVGQRSPLSLHSDNPPPPKLIGPILGGGTPWWKLVCGGSENQYTG